MGVPVATVISPFARWARVGVAPAAFLLVALAVGVVTGLKPTLGIAAACGIVFTMVVLWDLALGVCLFLLVTFLDVVTQNADLSLTKAAGALLAGSWLATMATRRTSREHLASGAPWLTLALLGFVAWSGLSAVWAEDPAAATLSTIRFGLDALLIPIVYWAVRERRHVFWIFAVFVAGAQLSVLWGLTHGREAGGAAAAQVGRLTGANVEANALATLLVVCAVLASALVLAARRSSIARTAALVAALTAMASFFGTFSRGGFIALGAAIIAGLVYGGRSRPALVILVVAAALVGSVFLRETTSDAVARLTSSNTSGRADIWRLGLRMVKAHPVVGVGSGNYTTAEPHYLLVSPGAIERADLLIDRPLVAHNIYLHVLAEMGVIGLALFLSVLGFSIGAAVRAVSLLRKRGDRALEVLGRALVVALVGILAADFFASEQYSKQLWLLLAMGPALLAVAQHVPDPSNRRAATAGNIDP